MQVGDLRKWKDSESEHAPLVQELAKGGAKRAHGPSRFEKNSILPLAVLLSLLALLRKILTSLLGPIGAS